MKQKFLSLLLIVTAIVTLTTAACGSEAELKESTSKTANQKEEPDTKDAEKKETNNDSEEKDVFFKDRTLKIDMATIKITATEVIPPNADYGKDKSSLVIFYDFTNTSDKLIQPFDAWIACFELTQETDVSVNRLETGFVPEGEKYQTPYDMAHTDIKTGATVQAMAVYELNDPSKPVTIKATQGIMGDELGEEVINLE